MNDLTQGSIPGHLFRMAAPIAAGMLFQTMYFLVDLYFVAKLGDSAIAGVGAAGSVTFIVMAMTQVLGVGTVALIAQAIGRKDLPDANLVFNQSLALAGVMTVICLLGGFLVAGAYMRRLGADPATTAAGVDYLRWYLPGLALQFAMVALISAMRGIGVAMPGMFVQMFTVLLNAFLAPVLIAGWLTGHPMGVAGAGLASTISVSAGTLMLLVYFARLEKNIGYDATMVRPQPATWRRILVIGLPAGGEFGLMFIYLALIYWLIRDFGAAAQAGFGVGSRVMQAIFLPAMAIAFAIAPIAGQNVGAALHQRVRDTFRIAVLCGTGLMVVLTALCQWRPEVLVGGFSSDPDVIAVAAQFLHIISWNFVATGIIFSCSGMFQALGNTLPSLFSSATRLATFALPALYLSSRGALDLRHLWLLSVATVAVQAGISLLLLRWQFSRRLGALPAAV